jgi:hypothetical protein
MGKDKLAVNLGAFNWSTWSTRMESLLDDLELRPAILAAPSTPEEVESSRKAINVMVKNVEDMHLATIKTAGNANAAWTTLAATFAAASNARRMQLRLQLRSSARSRRSLSLSTSLALASCSRTCLALVTPSRRRRWPGTSCAACRRRMT